MFDAVSLVDVYVVVREVDRDRGGGTGVEFSEIFAARAVLEDRSRGIGRQGVEVSLGVDIEVTEVARAWVDNGARGDSHCVVLEDSLVVLVAPEMPVWPDGCSADIAGAF